MKYRIGTHYMNGKKFELNSNTTDKVIKSFLKNNPEFKQAILLDDNITKESSDNSKSEIESGQAEHSESDND